MINILSCLLKRIGIITTFNMWTFAMLFNGKAIQPNLQFRGAGPFQHQPNDSTSENDRSGLRYVGFKFQWSMGSVDF